MIAENPQGAVIESTVEGERFAMGIDPEAYLHLMSVLENLYSNVQYSVLREVAVNALDSHIEAGTDRPIEVTLPTRDKPVLSVQDWGVGLSKDDIRDIYSQYGRSTKRSTNSVAGMLGVGCKSPFAYTNQFTVTAVKNGTLIRVVVAKDPDGASMTVIDEHETDEPNGVKVSIPTGLWNQFPQHAADLFKFWPKGSVLVDGEIPKTIEGIFISPTMMVTRELKDNHLLMGAVPYPADIDVKLDGNALIIFAPIGSVDFAPSREALRYTTKTKNYLKATAEEFDKAIVKSVQRTIDEADSKVEAFKRAIQWRTALAGRPQAAEKYTYKGEEIPREFKAPEGERWITTDRNSYKLSAHSRQQSIYAGTAMTSLIVHGYDPTKSFSAAKKKKLQEYTYQNFNGNAPRQYILAKDAFAQGWLPPEFIVPWSVIEAIKLDRGNGGRTKDIPGSYEVVKAYSLVQEVAANDLDQNNLFYIHRDMGRVWNERSDLATLFEEHHQAQLVIVPLNRLNKFQRDFPNAQPANDAAKKIFEKMLKGIPKRSWLIEEIRNDWYLKRMLEKIDPTKLKDPEFGKAHKLLKASPDPRIKKLRAYRFLMAYVGIKKIEPDLTNPFEKYPLWDDNHLEHSILYANMIYESENS